MRNIITLLILASFLTFIGCSNTESCCCDNGCHCMENGTCCCEEGKCKIECDCEGCDCSKQALLACGGNTEEKPLLVDTAS